MFRLRFWVKGLAPEESQRNSLRVQETQTLSFGEELVRYNPVAAPVGAVENAGRLDRLSFNLPAIVKQLGKLTKPVAPLQPAETLVLTPMRLTTTSEADCGPGGEYLVRLRGLNASGQQTGIREFLLENTCSWQEQEVTVQLNELGAGTVQLQWELYNPSSEDKLYIDELELLSLQVMQEESYYAYGLAMAGVGSLPSAADHHYLYQGKELENDFDLAWHDGAAYRFHARAFDAQRGGHPLGRWHVHDPAYQFASPYVGMGNNPVMGVDPDGKWAIVDDLAAALIGGVINLGSNIIQGNISGNFWEVLGQGAAAFGAGAASGTLSLYGPAGWIAGGAILGATNAGLAGTDMGMGMLTGAATGLAGGALGSKVAPVIGKLFNKIASPALQGFLSGAVGGAVTGGVIGGATSVAGGGSFLGGAASGALVGSITGGLAGAGGAIRTARGRGFNPWTGNRSKAWLQDNMQLNQQVIRAGPAAVKAEMRVAFEISRVDNQTAATRKGGINVEGIRLNREIKIISPVTDNIHRHHIFPQKFRTYFRSKGIDIDNYTVELVRSSHLKGIHGRGTSALSPGRWNQK